MKLEVGQKLWFVYYDHRRGGAHEVTVERVGKKWAYIGGKRRIDANTLVADGGNYSPSGRCYLSREAYETECALIKAWGDFARAAIRYCYLPPKGVTMAEIAEVRRILNLEVAADGKVTGRSQD